MTCLLEVRSQANTSIHLIFELYLTINILYISDEAVCGMSELWSMVSETSQVSLDSLADLSALEQHADVNNLQIVTPDGLSLSSQFEAVLHQLSYHVRLEDLHVATLRQDAFDYLKSHSSPVSKLFKNM